MNPSTPDYVLARLRNDPDGAVAAGAGLHLEERFADTTDRNSEAPKTTDGKHDGKVVAELSMQSSVASTPIDATLEQLERLSRLRELGHLSAIEFEALKAEVLDSGGGMAPV